MTDAGREELTDQFREYRRTRDRRLRNELVEKHMDVAEYYVKRYSRRGVPSDDLRQVALLTILRAVERFDPELGVSFSTFASRTIEGELKRYFRDRTWSVRPPRRAQELHLELRRAEEELTQRLGRAPTVADLAAELDVSEDHVLEALEAGVAHQATSLDQSPSDEDGANRTGRLLAQSEPGFQQVDHRVVIEDLLATLPERERLVLHLRFFENLTQPEIAERIGVSQSYLSRILRRTLVDLREKLEAADPAAGVAFGVVLAGARDETADAPPAADEATPVADETTMAEGARSAEAAEEPARPDEGGPTGGTGPADDGASTAEAVELRDRGAADDAVDAGAGGPHDDHGADDAVGPDGEAAAVPA